MRRLFAAGLLVAAGAVGLWRFPLSPSPASSGLAPAATTSNASPEPRCTFELGEGAAWAVSLRNFSSQPANEPVAPTPVEGPSFGATLVVEPLRSKGSSAILLARFTSVDAQTLAVRPHLGTAMLFEVSDRCELIAFAHSRAVDAATARAQQATVSGLWFRVPTRQAEPATAQDGIGTFSTLLFRDERVIQRRITAYSATWQQGVARPVIDDSYFSATLSRHGWFDSLSSTITLTGALPVKTRFELSASAREFDAHALEGSSRDEADYEWGNLLPVLDFPAESAKPVFSPIELRQQASLRDAAYPQVRDLFVARLETNQNVHEQWPLMARFLEAHPEAVPEYAKWLVGGELPSKRLGVAFLALGKAKVPEARDALLEIRNDQRVLPMNRLRANLALADRGDVGIELAQALSSDSTRINSANPVDSFLARNSALALGMMVGARARSAEVKKQARATIEALLAQGQSKRELSPAFGAMGNTGDPTYLDALRPFTRHPDPEVRAVASKGFRRLRPDQTEDLVTEWLTRETSPEVKRELFRVIYHQHLDAQPQVSPILAHLAALHLKEQPYVLTRQSLVRVLGPLAAKNPEAKAALLEQVKIEVSEQSGLYDLISQYVDGDEISRSLHTRADLWGTPTQATQPDGDPREPDSSFGSQGFETEVP